MTKSQEAKLATCERKTAIRERMQALLESDAAIRRRTRVAHSNVGFLMEHHQIIDELADIAENTARVDERAITILAKLIRALAHGTPFGADQYLDIQAALKVITEDNMH